MNRKQRRANKTGNQETRGTVNEETTENEIGRTPWGGMRLLTDEIKKILPPFSVIGEDDNWLGRETTLVARFFAPVGAATWYVVAGSPDTRRLSRYDDDFLCYGYATLNGQDWDWGTISIKELEEVRLPFGLHVERDIHFLPCPLVKRFPRVFGP